MNNSLKIANNRHLYLLRLWLLLLGSILTFISPKTSASSQPEFSVYCTSNFDATGECTDENSKNLKCTLVSGSLIECTNIENKRFECIQFGTIIAYQSQFSCVAKKEDNNSNKFNKTQDFRQNQFDFEEQEVTPSEMQGQSTPAVKTSNTKPSTSPKPEEKIIEFGDENNMLNVDFVDAF